MSEEEQLSFPTTKSRTLYAVPTTTPVGVPLSENGKSKGDESKSFSLNLNEQFSDSENTSSSSSDGEANGFGSKFSQRINTQLSRQKAQAAEEYRFQEQLKQVDFSDNCYSKDLFPQYSLLKYLVVHAGKAKKSSSHLLLRVWIPDTIVYGDGQPYWMYTSSDGILQKTTKFSSSNVMDKLGNSRYEDDVVAVSKRTKMFPSDESPAVLQRFVKCKGNKAAITRIHWRYGKVCKPWFITNTTEFRSTNRTTEKSNQDTHFITNIKGPFGSTKIFKLNKEAASEATKITKSIIDHLQIVLGTVFEEMVVDFIKDKFGQLWFLQIKSYKMKSSRLPANIRQRNVTTVFSIFDDKVDGVKNEGSLKKKPGRIGHEQRKCRFCMRILDEEETCFVMTTQMILETSSSMLLRLSRRQYRTLLGLQRGGDLGLEASRLYHPHNVCKICYSQYHVEKTLVSSMEEYAKVLALADSTIARPDNNKKSESAVTIESKVTERNTVQRVKMKNKTALKKSNVPLTSPGGASPNNKPQNISSSTMPIQVTLCRLMIAVHELHDIPAFLCPHPSKRTNLEGKTKYPKCVMRYELFGKAHEIPLNLSKSTFSKHRNRVTNELAVKQFRIHHFFATETPQQGPLPEKSGISEFIREQGQVELNFSQIVRNKQKSKKKVKGLKMLGQCQIPVLQFKSAFVKNATMMMPLGFDMELCQVRVSIGLERTREGFNSDAVGNVHFQNGVFVPQSFLPSTDPLPKEWIDSLTQQVDFKSNDNNQAGNKSSVNQNKYKSSKLEKIRSENEEKVDRGTITKNQSLVWYFQINLGGINNASLEKGFQLYNQNNHQLLGIQNIIQNAESFDPTEINSETSDATENCIDSEGLRDHIFKEGKETTNYLYAKYTVAGKAFYSSKAIIDSNSRQIDLEYANKHYIKGKHDSLQEYFSKDKSLKILLISSMTEWECETLGILKGIIAYADKTGHGCIKKREFLECFLLLKEQRLGYLESLDKEERHFNGYNKQIETLFNLGEYLEKIWKLQEGLNKLQLEESTTLTELVRLSFSVLRLRFIFIQFKCTTSVISIIRKRIHEIFFPSDRQNIEPELEELLSVRCKVLHLLLSTSDWIEVQNEEDRWGHLLNALAKVFIGNKEELRRKYEIGCEIRNSIGTHPLFMENERILYELELSYADFADGGSVIDGTFVFTDIVKKRKTVDSQVMEEKRRRGWEYLFRSTQEDVCAEVDLTELSYALQEIMDEIESEQGNDMPETGNILSNFEIEIPIRNTHRHKNYLDRKQCVEMKLVLEKLEEEGRELLSVNEALLECQLMKKRNTDPTCIVDIPYTTYPAYIHAKLSLNETRYGNLAKLLYLNDETSVTD